MESHLYIKGDNDLCWGCGQAHSQHPTFINRPPVIRRPSRIDRVQGGQLPRCEVRA
jgi:hypothetical protein